MHEEAFIADIRSKIATHRMRVGKQSVLRDVIDHDVAARLVMMVERKEHPWSSKALARAIGIAACVMVHYRRGKTTSGQPWPELAEALAAARNGDELKTRQSAAQKSADTRRALARKVTVWADTSGATHDSESAAIAASKRLSRNYAIVAFVRDLSPADCVGGVDALTCFLVDHADELAEILG